MTAPSHRTPGDAGLAGEERQLFERAVRHAAGRYTGQALDAALVELGWLDALDHDPHTAVSVVFEQQGRANVRSSSLDCVLGAHGAHGAASGIVLPVLGSVIPPGELDGDRVVVRGLGTAGLVDRETILVAARTPAAGVVAVPVVPSDIEIRSLGGIDPALGLLAVTGAASVVPAARANIDWSAAVALGQLAIAHELVGAARQMLDLARQHALGRVQFGRPIATFQAIRHRLADTLVAIEAADAALGVAWDDRSPVSAAMAKAVAARGARIAAKHCQQVLAGIGFTTEHPFHRYLRRVVVLDQLLGSGRALTVELGEDLLRSRRLPSLPPL